MAASGYTPISLYYSTTASAVPSSGNLVDGELAINTADEKLYFKNSSGTVKLLSSSAGAEGTVTSVGGTGTVNGLTLTGTVTTSGNLTLGGTLANVDLTTAVTGTLPIANGGTGTTSTTFVNLTTNVTGTLPVANGGTGITSFGTGVATWLGTPSSANLRSAVTDETGTGSLVFATTPTLVTPILGTPTSGTLTNCTGLPVSTGVSGLGANVATFLATPSSANLAAALTDETGSGSVVFSASPTFTGTVSAAGINISSFIDLADNDILRFGTSDDMEIYHNGTNNYIDLNVGNLIFRDNTTTRLTLARTTGDLTLTGDINCADNLVDRPVLHDYAVDGVNKGTLSGAETLDLSAGNYFYGSAVTGNITWTFSNPPASGDFGCFVLELINGGAYTQTWPASVDWPGGTAPTLTASGKDQLVFTTRDAGTTWLGFVAGLDIK